MVAFVCSPCYYTTQKTLSAEVESGRYPPEGHFKEMSPDGTLVSMVVTMVSVCFNRGVMELVAFPNCNLGG